MFPWNPDVVFLEIVQQDTYNSKDKKTTSSSSSSSSSSSLSHNWNFYTRDQIIELHASLDYRGKRENNLRGTFLNDYVDYHQIYLYIMPILTYMNFFHELFFMDSFS